MMLMPIDTSIILNNRPGTLTKNDQNDRLSSIEPII